MYILQFDVSILNFCTFLVASWSKNWLLVTRILWEVARQPTLPWLTMMFRESDEEYISSHLPIGVFFFVLSVSLKWNWNALVDNQLPSLVKMNNDCCWAIIFLFFCFSYNAMNNNLKKVSIIIETFFRLLFIAL